MGSMVLQYGGDDFGFIVLRRREIPLTMSELRGIEARECFWTLQTAVSSQVR